MRDVIVGVVEQQSIVVVEYRNSSFVELSAIEIIVEDHSCCWSCRHQRVVAEYHDFDQLSRIEELSHSMSFSLEH